MVTYREIARQLKWSKEYEILQVGSIYSDRIEFQEIRGLQNEIIITPSAIVRDYFDVRHSNVMIVSHSHRSASTMFSPQDINIYKQLITITSLLNIQLKDFLIKTEDELVSIHNHHEFDGIMKDVRTTLSSFRFKRGGIGGTGGGGLRSSGWKPSSKYRTKKR